MARLPLRHGVRHYAHGGAAAPHSVPASGNPTEIWGARARWWNPDDAGSITQSGGVVSAWLDSTATISLAQGNVADRPAYDATLLNGHPGLVFADGGDRLFIDAAALSLGFSTGSYWTWIQIFRYTTNAFNRPFGGISNGSTFHVGLGETSNAWSATHHVAGGATGSATGPAVDTTTTHIGIARNTSSLVPDLVLDGVAYASALSAGAGIYGNAGGGSPTDSITVASNPSGATTTACWVGDCVLVEGTVMNVELNSLGAWAAARYGTAWTGL